MQFLAEGLQLLRKENQNLKMQLQSSKSAIQTLNKLTTQKGLSANSNHISETQFSMVKFELQQTKAQLVRVSQLYNREKIKLQTQNTQHMKDAETRVELCVKQVQNIRRENSELYEQLQRTDRDYRQKLDHQIQIHNCSKCTFEEGIKNMREQCLKRIEKEQDKHQKQLQILKQEIGKQAKATKLLKEQNKNLKQCLQKLRTLLSTQTLKFNEESSLFSQQKSRLGRQLQALSKDRNSKEVQLVQKTVHMVELNHINRELQKSVKELTRRLTKLSKQNEKELTKEKIIRKRAEDNFTASQKYLKTQTQTARKKQKMMVQNQKSLASKVRDLQTKSAMGDYSTLSNNCNSMTTATATGKSSLQNSTMNVLNLTNLSEFDLQTPMVSKFNVQQEVGDKNNGKLRHSSLKLNTILTELTLQDLETPCFDSARNIKEEFIKKFKARKQQ